MAIHNTFHISLFEPYQDNRFLSQIKEPPPAIQIEGEDEYELDEIIDSRLHYNKLQYRAKWKGYSPEYDKVWYPQKTSTMQNTQSNDSTSATPERPEWIHVTINRRSSAPPPVVRQERHSCTSESDAHPVARNATPTSPEYSGSPRRKVAHASMSWTDCTDDGCQIHLGEKQGSGWYPQFTRRSKQPSVAHDHNWRPEMEANPGEDWAPQQQSRQRRARRVYEDFTAGTIALTTIAMNTDGTRWTPPITPDRWGKKGHCRSTTGGNTRREEP